MGAQSASTVVSALCARSAVGVCNLRKHGRQRYSCKECGGGAVCEHGRRRSQCKECGGGSICEHGRVALWVQGVRWGLNLRARSSALSVQGVRWVWNLRARSSALYVQGVRWVSDLRARSSALSVQGVRWCIHLRARPSAPSLQGVRWVSNLRARSSTLQMQGTSRRGVSNVVMNPAGALHSTQCSTQRGQQTITARVRWTSSICKHARRRTRRSPRSAFSASNASYADALFTFSSSKNWNAASMKNKKRGFNLMAAAHERLVRPSANALSPRLVVHLFQRPGHAVGFVPPRRGDQGRCLADQKCRRSCAFAIPASSLSAPSSRRRACTRLPRSPAAPQRVAPPPPPPRPALTISRLFARPSLQHGEGVPRWRRAAASRVALPFSPIPVFASTSSPLTICVDASSGSPLTRPL